MYVYKTKFRYAQNEKSVKERPDKRGEGRVGQGRAGLGLGLGRASALVDGQTSVEGSVLGMG